MGLSTTPHFEEMARCGENLIALAFAFQQHFENPCSAVVGCFCSSRQPRQRGQKQRTRGQGLTERNEGGRARGGAVRDKTLLVFVLARQRAMSLRDRPSLAFQRRTSE